jgi:hypothetical protein
VKAEYEIGTEEMMELNQAESVDLKPNRIRRDDPDIRIFEGRESGQSLQQQKLFGLGPEESSGQFTYGFVTHTLCSGSDFKPRA